ncbi:MAG: glycosyltransferase family 2 protein [Pseudomonadota bacterium]
MAHPKVSVCIPAYRCEAFIAATLESVFDQTLTEVEVIVSNDGGAASPTLERLHAAGRIRLLEPPERLGWVRNSNFVLSAAQGPYAMILPHDDALAPRFLERCVALLEAEPQAIAAYSDLSVRSDQRFARRRAFPASEVRGTVAERLRTVMRDRYNGISYRAVLRQADLVRHGLRLCEDQDLWADTLWMMQKAVHGELRRVPEPLYIKRLHGTNTHAKWERQPPAVVRAAWEAHCAQMGKIAAAALDPATVEALVHHRRDPARVQEAPAFLLAAFGAPPRRRPSLATRVARRLRRLAS